MNTLASSGAEPLTLSPNGNRPVTLGQSLEGEDLTRSIERGSDGMAASFGSTRHPESGSGDPGDHGWLSLDGRRLKRLRPREATSSLYVRARFDSPDGQGTLFFSDWIGLAVTPEGLAVAFLGLKTQGGCTYREFPLGIVERDVWLDLVLRVRPQHLDFICNGVLRNSVAVGGEMSSPFERELMLGAFPGKPSLPQERSNFLVAAKIDTVALWDVSLTDSQVKSLSGRGSQGEAQSDCTSQTIARYNEFYAASGRKDVERCRELGRWIRDFMRQDPTRPIFHLTAPIGRIFDPAGAFQFQGTYHVFSYHEIYPFIVFNSHDHYASEDLVHWNDWPIGPVADSAVDAYGIWLSNHVVDDEGYPNVFYGSWKRDGNGYEHGVRAISRDGLVSYEDKKVVFPEYHDGHLWKEGDTWFAITMRHSAFKSFRTPEILVFTSPNLDHWTERGVLFSFPSRYSFAEFPYLFEMGGRHVLMAGFYPGHDSRYWIGTFDRESFRFIPDDPEGLRVDYANAFHCFNPSIIDCKGPEGTQRRIMMAMETRCRGSVNGLPWSGVHAMPKVLTLDGNHLHQDPLPELHMLRSAHYSVRDIVVGPDSPRRIEKRGDALEIVAEFQRHGARMFGFKVRVSGDDTTYVRVFYDAVTDECGVDGNIQPVSMDSAGPKQGRGPAYCRDAEEVQIKVFLDKALVESFVNGQTCTTSLVDTNPEHDGIEVFSEGGYAVCTKLDIWEMTRSV